MTGQDGRVYKAARAKRSNPYNNKNRTRQESSVESIETTGVKKLLNMKWDHLGLKNYNSTIEMISKLGSGELAAGQSVGGSRQLPFAARRGSNGSMQIEFNIYNEQPSTEINR